MTDNIAFEPNLERRVKNLALGPRNPANALVPIFEAIYNAIHACQDRFGDDWAAHARIIVYLRNWAKAGTTVEINDNGVGLNEDNFRSFRTYDSDHKLERGGKGVGRLSWLKVFDSATVISVYADDKLMRRSFTLRLSNARPFEDYQHIASTDRVGTTVILNNMKPEYIAKLPQRPEIVAKKITAHFANFLMGSEAPEILVDVDGVVTDLRNLLSDKKIYLKSSTITISDVGTFTIDHYLLQRGMLDSGSMHRIMLTAHGRVVSEREIGEALGVKTLIERPEGKYVYVGLVSSDALDSSVNSERTAFDIDPDVIAAIERESLRTVTEAIAPQIDRVKRQQTDLTRNVVKKYPRYAYLVKNAEDFVERKIPRNFNRAEQIYQHLALYDFRANRDLEREMESLAKEKGDPDSNVDAVEAGVAKLLERVNEQEFSVLADYTVRRRVILDLLDKQLGYQADGTMKRSSEEAVHDFVVPIRTTSHDIDIMNHNLWIIDDKLTYYEFWASDKKLKTVLLQSDSNVRPDVLLFSGQTAFHRPGTDQPIVIVEFKRPARTAYDEEENPIVQVFEYIEELRGGSAVDKNGVIIQEVSDSTPFFCYIIADITPNLLRYLKLTKMNLPMPGGSGYYGFNEDYNAYVQVFSFKHIVKDARLRNEAFFKRLGI